MKRRTVMGLEGESLRDAVARALRCSAEDATAMVERGGAYLEGKRCRTPHARAASLRVMVVGELGVPQALPAMTLLFEDAVLVAFNKPPGVVSQPTPSASEESVVDIASRQLGGRPLTLLHRLDRETSGVILLCQSDVSVPALMAAFREGDVKKEYVALARGPLPDSGEVSVHLARDTAHKGRWKVAGHQNEIDSHTRFRVERRRGEVSEVALFPSTGRTHQLRVHLSSLGAPIVGDVLYGGERSDAVDMAAGTAPRCLLHASKIEILGRKIEAPLWPDMEEARAQLAG